MPTITIEARLVRIGARLPRAGEWLLIHADDTYEILEHAQALALQGKHARAPKRAPEPHVPNPPPPTRKIHHLPLRQANFIMVAGKKLFIQPKLLAAIRFIADHGPATVRDAPNPSFAQAFTAAKALGLLESTNADDTSFRQLYDLTNNGRAVAAALAGRELPVNPATHS